MATLKNVTVNDTGFIRIATGTTAERPGTPTAGMMRYNTDLSANEFYNGSQWVTVGDASVGTSSTGGSITNAAGFRIHTFTSAGTFVPSKTGVLDVLVIAGGGGGAGLGGGGGAGGYVYCAGVPVIAGTSYPVAIGTGGTGPTAHGPAAPNGNPSTFGGSTPVEITTIGGGGGWGYNGGTSPPGGSGGGGPGYGQGSETFRPAAAGTPGQGHPGGFGAHFNGTPNGTHYGGGGGGGAGTQGYNRGGRYQQARGGEGMASSITGTTVYRAGGGAGGAHNTNVPHGAASLAGRGSNGNSLAPNGNNPGGTNNGGGGAGTNHSGSSPDTRGVGGPGVVIVRYRG